MSMLIYAVDLGTTNIKVVLFDERAAELAAAAEPMSYRRDGAGVEFDPDAVTDAVLRLIAQCADAAAVGADHDAQIVVTGQAESLVLVGADGRPLVPGISWMDERSTAEADEIAAHFGTDAAFAVTGQPEAVATWPATKLRWFAAHRPEILTAAAHVLMIKDYVLLRFTGRTVGEETTRGFTYLYDVPGRRYWDDMVAFCGIRRDQLPEVVAAGSRVGPVLEAVAAQLPPAHSYTVNAGALDHFCAMLGQSSYAAGAVSASAGTVLALSVLATDWTFDPASRVSFHPGLRAGETVLFGCADSGGVAVEWFRAGIAGGISYDALERELRERDHRDAPVFLPYLTGVNPPDFNPDARGAFVDLQLRHDRVDLAYAVMEGVAHLLRRNIDDLRRSHIAVDEIVSAGGGTASAFWNQLKADATGIPLRVPDQQEAACRGAAVLALVEAGVLDSIDDLQGLDAPAEHVYRPHADPERARRYSRFDTALARLYPQAAPTPLREKDR